jgi:hypothetical protein
MFSLLYFIFTAESAAGEIYEWSKAITYLYYDLLALGL